MLKLTNLVGFAAGGAGTDVVPNAINFDDISDAGLVASAETNTQIISGIDTSITLRLTLSTPMSAQRYVNALRDGALAAQASSGTFIDVTLVNGQSLKYQFTNAAELTMWAGTATLTNLTDNNAVLDSFTFTLTDTGSGGGGGGGGGGEGGGGELP